MSLTARQVFRAATTMMVAGLVASVSSAQAPAEDELAFRALYKELVEINTTRSVGSCTKAAEAMRARLLAAGIPAGDMQILAPPDRPEDGALIAVLRGSDARRARCCCWRISTWSKQGAKTGSVIHSSWSRKTAGSMRAAPATTRPWLRYSPTA